MLFCTEGSANTSKGESCSPEDRSFLQQSEKPLRAAKCRGNMPWIPRLNKEREKKIHLVSCKRDTTSGFRKWLLIARNRLYELQSSRRVSALERLCDTNAWEKPAERLTYLAVSALLLTSVLMRSSCPYRAAMCSGVFPFLSSQSISAPSGEKETSKHTKQALSCRYTKKTRSNFCFCVHPEKSRSLSSPFSMIAWDLENLPWIAVMWSGVFPSLLWIETKTYCTTS